MASLHQDLESLLIHAGRMLSSPLSATATATAPLISLLDRTQLLLFRVNQSPPNSTLFALYPARDALVADHLTSHPDIDVRVAVASCLSEVMRITAPDAPYSDDVLKVVFKLIVEAVQGLDDMSSRSFTKRVAVLEAAAKVRYSVVMLDLQLDHLILDMFRSFLKTISPHNAEVITLMEAVMTAALDECESENPILPELVCCLLDGVAQDNEAVLPITRRLAEKVISNCAGKVKSLVKLQSDWRGTQGQQQIHRSLKARLAAAEKELAAAEQEKLDKEARAHKLLMEQQLLMHKLLMEQQLLMENMVERPGTLKQEEENAKFRELLIEGGCIVDKLMVEVSVAHDERVSDKRLKSTN